MTPSQGGSYYGVDKLVKHDKPKEKRLPPWRFNSGSPRTNGPKDPKPASVTDNGRCTCYSESFAENMPSSVVSSMPQGHPE